MRYARETDGAFAGGRRIVGVVTEYAAVRFLAALGLVGNPHPTRSRRAAEPASVDGGGLAPPAF